ncbi:hypothetical protein A5893_07600 [Pedobacter psychrophilus]|uniref:Uncharacterized protein n=1 Tax=Pedobacter psychrophilus TaxID=1826909 RepID=A0A179DJ36_9SPHI|nr:hypothetical protein [Pedobacter psychrophilus]OAQ40792.1 hypothetical protein A5893_07600 [Pedobacter psychrophilus]
MELPEDTIISENGKIHIKGIDLEDSWLLGIEYFENKSLLIIDLEFSIWPESKYYSKPKENEWTCYKKGQIKFKEVEQLNGIISLKDFKPSIDSESEKDWGNIYGLRIEENKFKFETNDSKISLFANQLELSIK